MITGTAPKYRGAERYLRLHTGALKIAIAIAALGGSAWIARSFYGGGASPPLTHMPVTPVASAIATTGEFPVIFSGLGAVTPSATSVVKAQVSGQLLEVKFAEGQIVKAGDLLAQIDPRLYQFSLDQAEGQYQKDFALLENAERDLLRYEALRLRVKDAVSGQQIDTQKSLISQYKATIAIDRAVVDQARLNLSYCRVVSLIDGRIGLRQVDPGNYVQSNDTNGLAVITRLSPITVVFSLPESQLQPVLNKFRSGESLVAVAFDHEKTTELARGRLYAIDNQIDASSGTIKLRAEFPNEDEKLYPNQFVNVDLLAETLHNVTLVPAAAVQRGAKGPFIYRVAPNNTVSARPIKLGPGDGEKFVVEDGLAAGDRVVVDGADRLREGSKIVDPGADQLAPTGGSHTAPARASGPRPKSSAS